MIGKVRARGGGSLCATEGSLTLPTYSCVQVSVVPAN
jgi:hypothetical protein